MRLTKEGKYVRDRCSNSENEVHCVLGRAKNFSVSLIERGAILHEISRNRGAIFTKTPKYLV